jgi:hypothetical protein
VGLLPWLLTFNTNSSAQMTVSGSWARSLVRECARTSQAGGA